MHAKRPAGAPMDPVRTPRLVLTPVGTDDVDDLVVLYSDPVVAYGTGPWTRDEGVGRGHGGLATSG
jgi:hypothetical protein